MEKRNTIDRSRIVGPEVSEALFCKICKELMEDPMECSECNVGFCKNCINSWMVSHRTCPSSCAESKIRKAHLLVRNMLNSVQIKCENEKNGCKKIVTYEHMKKHTAECEYSTVPCRFQANGCEVRILAKDIKAHEADCGFLLIKCDKGCEQSLLKKNVAGHSCITMVKDMILDSRSKIQQLSEEAKKLSCDLARAQFRNLCVGCDSCRETDFEGVSYRCKTCDDFDLCAACFKIKRHEHEMKKIYPLAFYTEVLETKVESYSEEKMKVDALILVKNYDDMAHVIRFQPLRLFNVEYLYNDYFELEPRGEIKKVFAFIVPKGGYKGIYRYYINSLDCERFFGLPFNLELR